VGSVEATTVDNVGFAGMGPIPIVDVEYTFVMVAGIEDAQKLAPRLPVTEVFDVKVYPLDIDCKTVSSATALCVTRSD
jgi:hypothetical protein